MTIWHWFALACYVAAIALQYNWYRKQDKRGIKAFLGWKE